MPRNRYWLGIFLCFSIFLFFIFLVIVSLFSQGIFFYLAIKTCATLDGFLFTYTCVRVRACLSQSSAMKRSVDSIPAGDFVIAKRGQRVALLREFWHPRGVWKNLMVFCGRGRRTRNDYEEKHFAECHTNANWMLMTKPPSYWCGRRLCFSQKALFFTADMTTVKVTFPVFSKEIEVECIFLFLPNTLRPTVKLSWNYFKNA